MLAMNVITITPSLCYDKTDEKENKIKLLGLVILNKQLHGTD